MSYLGGYRSGYRGVVPGELRQEFIRDALPPDMGEESFRLGDALFGEDPRGHVVVEQFTPTAPTKRSVVSPNSRSDSVRFGREYKTPSVWSWSLYINRQSDHEAYRTYDLLERVWDNEELRLASEAVTPLRARIGGRNLRVYGRPGRLQVAPPDVRRKSGFLAVEAEFELVDTLVYEEEEQTSGRLRLGEATVTGGLKSPLKSPLRSVSSTGTGRAGYFEVGGSARTPLHVEVNGPLENGTVLVDEVAIGIKRLEYDETIIIDARPWVTSATFPDGRSAAGRLTPASRIDRLRVGPGGHQLSLTGTDLTGTASATVAWRNARRSI